MGRDCRPRQSGGILFFALHIPDGFVSVSVSSVGWFIAVVALFVALRAPSGTTAEGPKAPAPLAGLLGAFVFAAQAMNFPVGVGTSGHLIGTALLTIVLGAWPAVVIVCSVLLVQCLLFQDGGLLAWGCNVFNMAILPSFCTAAVMRATSALLGKGRPRTLLVGSALAGWLSVEAGAISCSLMLAVSGTSLLGPTLESMVAVHAPIGLVEGLITMMTVAFLLKTRPELVKGEEASSSSGWVGGGLLAAVALALASPLASKSPDGLDHVAEHLGFIEKTKPSFYQLFPDYKLPFITHPAATTALAVVLGTLVVFGLAWLLAGRLTSVREAS